MRRCVGLWTIDGVFWKSYARVRVVGTVHKKVRISATGNVHRSFPSLRNVNRDAECGQARRTRPAAPVVSRLPRGIDIRVSSRLPLRFPVCVYISDRGHFEQFQRTRTCAWLSRTPSVVQSARHTVSPSEFSLKRRRGATSTPRAQPDSPVYRFAFHSLKLRYVSSGRSGKMEPVHTTTSTGRVSF